MKKHITLITLFLFSTLFIQTLSKELPEILEVEMEHHTGEGRSLASYPNMRIAVDYTYVTSGTDSFKSYVKTQLIPSIVSFYQAALKVRYPVTSKITTTKDTICGYDTPASLKAGVSADMFFLINTQVSTSSWVGITTACALGASNGITRPLIVTIGINSRLMSEADPVNDPLTHDLNINTIMHEFLHGFAVRGSLYDYFVDEKGKLLSAHVQEQDFAGETLQVLDLPPLTKRLRSYYNCSTVPGIIMENDGGAHFERRYFAFDLMSTGGIIDAKLTEFDLGFLEGTGWYVPDYSYAEPYFFGKGQGCGFIFDDCDPEKFKEFCTGAEKGCGAQGNSGGRCTDDSKSGKCQYYLTQRAFNCEYPTGTAYTTFATNQVYGRGLGSKCFSGNITSKKTTVSQNTYCFTYTCLKSGKTLRVNFGTQTFDCTKEGPLKIFDYNGFINCPDPVTFCNTVGKPSCPKSCMGQGTCVSGKCVCNAGYQGSNCAFTI